MKRESKLPTWVLTFSLIVGTAFIGSFAQAATPRKPSAGPDVRSTKVLVLDSEDHSVLYSRHADEVAPIASITKLMTALVVLDGKQPLDEVLEVTKADRKAALGSASSLPVGAKLTRGDLLHLALMSSDNQAAHCLGRNYPGGLAEFVRTMNLKADALEMKNTRFSDPSGLSSENVSNAHDLAKLVMAADRSRLIRKYSTTRSHSVRVGKRMMEFRNTNSLVSNPNWQVAVQKTGFTNDAGRCLVMETKIQERSVVIVLLDSYGKHTRVADAKRIRQWMEAKTHSLRSAPALTSAQ